MNSGTRLTFLIAIAVALPLANHATATGQTASHDVLMTSGYIDGDAEALFDFETPNIGQGLPESEPDEPVHYLFEDGELHRQVETIEALREFCRENQPEPFPVADSYPQHNLEEAHLANAHTAWKPAEEEIASASNSLRHGQMDRQQLRQPMHADFPNDHDTASLNTDAYATEKHDGELDTRYGDTRYGDTHYEDAHYDESVYPATFEQTTAGARPAGSESVPAGFEAFSQPSSVAESTAVPNGNSTAQSNTPLPSTSTPPMPQAMQAEATPGTQLPHPMPPGTQPATTLRAGPQPATAVAAGTDPSAVPVAMAPPVTTPTMGPALPEGINMEIPVSDQEIGQLDEHIQSQRTRALRGTEDEIKRQTTLLDNAQKSLSQANKYLWKDIAQQDRAGKFDSQKEQLMAELEEVREAREPDEAESAEGLFAVLEQLRLDSSEKNDRLREINKSELQRKKRMEKIPEERAKAKALLADNRKLFKSQEGGESDAFAMILLRAEELELTYQLKSLASESKLHELENRLLPMRADSLSREIKLLQTEIDQWNFAANERRRLDIEEEVRQARLQVINAAPALKNLANINANLSQRRAEFAEKIRVATEEDLQIQELMNDVRNQHEAVEKSSVGCISTEANGMLMVEVRRTLPRPFQSLARIEEIQKDLRSINLEQLHLNDQRKPLAHPYEYVDQILDGVDSPTVSPEQLKETALEFVENIRHQYDQLSNDHHKYTELLGKIVAERKELVGEIESTLAFVDEQSLWIQSARPMGLDHVQKTRFAIAEFFGPTHWYELSQSLTQRTRKSPHESVGGLMGLVALFVFSRRFKG